MYYDIKASGLRIKELRRKNNMSQRELAESIGLSEVAIGNIERGVNGASVDTLGIIAATLGCSVDYIAFGKVIMEIPEELLGVVTELIKIVNSKQIYSNAMGNL